MAKQYSLISSVEGDWHIAAYHDKPVMVLLHEGHSRAQCYEAILKDLEIEVLQVERDMGEGNYFPRKKDFAKPPKKVKCTTKTKK